MSEKLIYQTYGGEPDDLYGRGLNNSIGGSGSDQKATYGPDQLFGNGLPYIRTGHWYKYETWMVLNSALDVNDGVLQVWIDDALVYSDTSVAWLSSQRGITQGGNYWADMRFGGNYSGGDWDSDEHPHRDRLSLHRRYLPLHNPGQIILEAVQLSDHTQLERH
jgi:hypothetical protein